MKKLLINILTNRHFDFIIYKQIFEEINCMKRTFKVAFYFCLLVFASLKINAQAPTITSFTPVSGAVGDTITLIGTGFNSIPANNIVFFGATRATVLTASANSLTTKVPLGATYAPINILNISNALTAYSSQIFNPIFIPNIGRISTADISPKLDFPTSSGPCSSAIGDVDGDGKADLVIVNQYSYTVSVLRNIGTSGNVNFASKIDFATGTTPRSVSIGDIDGDGKPDLAIVNEASNSVSLLRNTGNVGIIGFATKVDFATGGLPQSVSMGDLDGDGKLDLVVANSSDTTISVLRNTSISGNISIANKVDFKTAQSPYSSVIGDIDGDFKPDLAVANLNGNSVSVFRNLCSTGMINFDNKVDFLVGTRPISLIICDIDGDNKLDLSVTNNSSNTISVLLNTSINNIPSFAQKADFSIGLNPSSIATGDIDGDGKPDLGITNYQSGTISILRNTSFIGSANFALNVDFNSTLGPSSVSIGDFDGDGKSDISVTNIASNIVSVFRNNPNPQLHPTITVNGSLVPFSSCFGAVSSQQNFIVSGIDLSTNIFITPPLGYEVSTTSGSNFKSSLSLSPIAGNVNNTVIYIRLTNAATGAPNGNITVSYTGLSPQNVNATGVVNVIPTISLGTISYVTPNATSFGIPYTIHLEILINIVLLQVLHR
jgi:hypothetical protein